MKLEGYTNNNEYKLNCAINCVARKLKIDIWQNEKSPFNGHKNMDEIPINDRIDYLITIADKLYKY